MTEISSECSKFDSILAEAIDEALSVCGERAKSAFYAHLEKALDIPRREISTRIEEFSRALEDLFGVGALVLEILVMKSLYSRIGIAWKWKAPSSQDCRRARNLPNLTFKEYVNLAKKFYEDATKEDEQRGTWIHEL